MGRITRPKMEILNFGTEDVIATSGIPVYSMPVNNINKENWYLIMNGEGGKSFSEWFSQEAGMTPEHASSDYETLFLVYFSGGDWYDIQYGYTPGGTYIADSTKPEHTGLTYIWYGSGFGMGNVSFNTQGKSWSYYLDNNIPLPMSTN